MESTDNIMARIAVRFCIPMRVSPLMRRIMQSEQTTLDKAHLERCFAKPDNEEQNLIDLCWDYAEIDFHENN